MIQEREKHGINGYAMILFIAIAGIVCLSALATQQDTMYVLAMSGFMILGFFLTGFFIIQPNEAKALVLFGKYKGTIKQDGLRWAFPLYKKEHITLRASNFDTQKIKVNDKNGNPIIISAVIVWKVEDTAKALYAVDNYAAFVHTQSESALRSLAGRYAYESFSDDHHAEVTLRQEADVVNQQLEQALVERLAEAGIAILEARINHLAYAEEIASSMLQRQQASAVVAARREIVTGAVGMVEMALAQLSEKNLVELDNDKKAAMVSNLMVVLVGDQSTQPIVNTGTLYN